MRSRFVVSCAVIGLASVSLFACSSDKGSDTNVAADTVATGETVAVDSVAADSVAAESVAGDSVGADTVASSAASALPLDKIAMSSSECPATDGSAPRHTKFDAEPKMCIDAAKKYVAVMETSKGSMTFELDPKRAPKTVNSFVFLARQHYFEGIKFHRVVPDFVLQGGDPFSISDGADGPVGTGGPGYAFADELPQPGEYKVGSLVMANSGADTNGSQFFIVSGPNGVQLPANYALFGQLTDGQSSVDAIGALAVSDGPPSEPVIIKSVTITES